MLKVCKIWTKKKQRTAPLDSDAWIFDAMNIAKTAVSASKLVPVAGPFIEGGATLFYSALEQLKQMRKNKEDFKGLSEDIAILLQTFSEATAGRTSDSAYPEGFVRVCAGFKTSMERLANEIGLLVANPETKRLKSYFRADQIREAIAGYQAEIQTLRRNLMFYCTLSTSVRLFEADRLTGSSDEDFPELKDVLQSDIYLKEEVVSVDPYGYTARSRFVKEYHTTTSFNGKEYSTTTRSFEPGESGQERLKAELKLLARIRHPNITQVAAVCFSKSFPSIVYYDDLRPIDWDLEDDRIRDGPYTISYLTGLYRQMRSQREALVHIIDKLPSFFIPRDVLDNPDIGFAWWSLGVWESPSTRGILRVNVLRMPFQIEAAPRTNSKNTLRQIECQEEEKLNPSKEVITSPLRALFHIILYTRDYKDFRVEPHRAEPPYLGTIYYHRADRWELTPIGKKPQAVGIFPLESHHCQCGNWTTVTNTEPAFGKLVHVLPEKYG
ncbi:hypothetical protein M422DRAFT_271732 [Sphaerobolus stellatus SS14]|uniref:Protein kinase domain-containing protein n=1 Tax=Sphaerobolus stellatus (strain SS14) TaxID=990650 RepID=A0A0C9UP71_SPHS4|nr:hypothetical protein M422DRAFT_271732 [Sphaerobolus stellatus SS14]